MSAPWNFVKAFENKTFEQSSKETNESVPTKIGISISLEQYQKEPVKALDDAAKFGRVNIVENNEIVMIIDRNPPPPIEIVLPPEEPMIKMTVPVEKPKQKRKKRKK